MREVLSEESLLGFGVAKDFQLLRNLVSYWIECPKHSTVWFLNQGKAYCDKCNVQ